MKKLSVNGKTFDEIFGERGEQVQPESMKNGEIYYLDQRGIYGWNWIVMLRKLESDSVFSASEVCSDGEHEIGGHYHPTAGLSDVKTFHVATENQIALLEAYRTNA